MPASQVTLLAIELERDPPIACASSNFGFTTGCDHNDGSLIMTPKDIQALIPGACGYYFLWEKGFSTCEQVEMRRLSRIT